MKNRTQKMLILLSAFSILLAGSNAIAGKPNPATKTAAKAGPRQYIFSLSSNQKASESLGLTGVSAYVNFPNGSQKRGIYVTQTRAKSLSLNMGLRPGTVLISIDGSPVETPNNLDNIMASKGQAFNYSYVKLVGGLPQIFEKRSVSYERGLAASSSQPAGYGLQHEDTTPLSQLESQMASLVNSDRSKEGKPTISENSRMANLARSYAEYLLSHGEFAHVDKLGRDPMDRLHAAGITGGNCENLAYQSRGLKKDSQCVIDAEKAFMSEPPNQHNHRWNILWSEAKSFGVGMARSKTTLMMVQEFSDGNP